MSLPPIPASELILTPRGSIYHLDVHPSELADTIIIVGNPDRVAAISQYFDQLEHQLQHREFVTHTGYLGSKRISVVSTGIGSDNIDIVLNELDALANIDFDTRTLRSVSQKLKIIRLGTSGSLQSDIPVNSLVTSSYGIGLDNLMHFYNYQPNAEEEAVLDSFLTHTGLGRSKIIPYITSGSMALRHHFLDGFHQGITVTCPGFYGPQGRILTLKLALPNLVELLSSFSHHDHQITNFEMETSAVYGLGKLLGHQCLSINTIIANRVDGTFSSNPAGSIDMMIRKCLEIIERF